MIEFFTSLVLAVEGEPRASSEVIARGVEQQHASVLKLVRKHQQSFEEFGRVGFEIRTFDTRGGKQHREFAMLNEQQSTLLLAFMRNTPKVIEFKVALIKEFYRMQGEIQNRDKNLWQQMQALISREVESKVRATFGSHLMLERKREIPQFDEERYRLESQIQPSLLTH